MTMEKQPFEDVSDVSPIQNGNFPASHLFFWGGGGVTSHLLRSFPPFFLDRLRLWNTSRALKFHLPMIPRLEGRKVATIAVGHLDFGGATGGRFNGSKS